jgi:hypothetical protein
MEQFRQAHGTDMSDADIAAGRAKLHAYFRSIGREPKAVKS